MALADLTWAPYEPKTTNRFIMYLNGIPSYIIKATSRPQAQVDTLTIDHINIQRKFKGKMTWQDIGITLYDPITAYGTQAVFDWVKEHHDAVTGVDGYAVEYKRELQFDALSPDGIVVERWLIHGAFISNVNWGQWDWSQSDVATVELSLAYDYATMVNIDFETTGPVYGSNV